MTWALRCWKNTNMTMTLPLKEPSAQTSFWRSLYNKGIWLQYKAPYLKGPVQWLLGGDENVGSEDFLVNARRLLIQERAYAKVQKKNEMKQKRKKMRLEEKVRRH